MNLEAGGDMLATQKKSVYEHGIEYYAQDGRLTADPDYNRGRYNDRAAYELVVKLGRPLTEEEYEQFRIR